jgi:hypothetical protein
MTTPVKQLGRLAPPTRCPNNMVWRRLLNNLSCGRVRMHGVFAWVLIGCLVGASPQEPRREADASATACAHTLSRAFTSLGSSPVTGSSVRTVQQIARRRGPRGKGSSVGAALVDRHESNSIPHPQPLVNHIPMHSACFLLHDHSTWRACSLNLVRSSALPGKAGQRQRGEAAVGCDSAPCEVLCVQMPPRRFDAKWTCARRRINVNDWAGVSRFSRRLPGLEMRQLPEAGELPPLLAVSTPETESAQDGISTVQSQGRSRPRSRHARTSSMSIATPRLAGESPPPPPRTTTGTGTSSCSCSWRRCLRIRHARSSHTSRAAIRCRCRLPPRRPSAPGGHRASVSLAYSLALAPGHHGACAPRSGVPGSDAADGACCGSSRGGHARYVAAAAAFTSDRTSSNSSSSSSFSSSPPSSSSSASPASEPSMDRRDMRLLMSHSSSSSSSSAVKWSSSSSWAMTSRRVGRGGASVDGEAIPSGRSSSGTCLIDR